MDEGMSLVSCLGIEVMLVCVLCFAVVIFCVTKYFKPKFNVLQKVGVIICAIACVILMAASAFVNSTNMKLIGCIINLGIIITMVGNICVIRKK